VVQARGENKISMRRLRWRAPLYCLKFAAVHALLLATPFLLLLVLGVNPYGPRTANAALFSRMLAFPVVWIVYRIISREFGESVQPHIELAIVPIELIRAEVRFRSLCLLPHTCLFVCASVAVLVVASRLEANSPESARLTNWFLLWWSFCGLMGIHFFGQWLQRKLIQLIGPSSQERYARMAEVMESGARTPPLNHATDTNRKSKNPFDRPPV